MEWITPESTIKTVDRINGYFIYDGLPSRLEDLVPLLHIGYYGGEFSVQYCGFNLWDSTADSQHMTEEAFERFLVARIAEVRKVLIHTTAGIPNSVLDAVIDEAEEKL